MKAKIFTLWKREKTNQSTFAQTDHSEFDLQAYIL